MDHDVTNVPTDIVQALSLEDGIKYVGQNLSTTDTLFMRRVSTLPGVDSRAFSFEAKQKFSFFAGDSPIYLWTDSSTSIPIILDKYGWCPADI